MTRSHLRLSSSESEVVCEIGLADLIAATDDAVAASMLAAELLQQQGWKPVAITTAEQGYDRDDFLNHPAAVSLYQAAQQQGYGLSVATTSPLEPIDSGSRDALRTA